jgi:hypothetical protein
VTEVAVFVGGSAGERLFIAGLSLPFSSENHVKFVTTILLTGSHNLTLTQIIASSLTNDTVNLGLARGMRAWKRG